MKPSVTFTLSDTLSASEQWSFNCGPAALCAVAGRKPDEALDHLWDFQRKGYTNPTMMARGLRSLKIPFQRVLDERAAAKVTGWPMMADLPDVAAVGCCSEPIYPDFGLVRIQWGGPWTKPGVPAAARYRHTHWIAVCDEWRFDINAMSVGGWIGRVEWEGQLIPWLLKQCEPKATGGWWPTHCWQIPR